MPNMSATRRRSPHMQLIALRVNTGLSRADFADRIGLGRETVRMAEAGFVPTVRVQFKIAEAFKLLPLDLWPIESQRRPSPIRRKPLTPAGADRVAA